MLLGLNDRLEIENTYTKLRDLKHSGPLYQIMVAEILAHSA